MLLVNSNKDCKEEFNRYVDTCVKIDKILQKVDTYKDYEKIKNYARTEMIKKIGNQILKSIKETKTEEYKRKSAEWKEKREYWNFKHKEFEQKQGEYMEKTEEFEIIINDIDTFALYLKYRENPYVLITEICLQISNEILKLQILHKVV